MCNWVRKKIFKLNQAANLCISTCLLHNITSYQPKRTFVQRVLLTVSWIQLNSAHTSSFFCKAEDEGHVYVCVWGIQEHITKILGQYFSDSTNVRVTSIAYHAPNFDGNDKNNICVKTSTIPLSLLYFMVVVVFISLVLCCALLDLTRSPVLRLYNRYAARLIFSHHTMCVCVPCSNTLLATTTVAVNSMCPSIQVGARLSSPTDSI